MKQRAQISYTESQKSLMWERWKKGDSLQTIAQLFGRNHSSVQGIFAMWSQVSSYSQEGLDEVARKLNERPRKTLNYQTPAQRFEECVAWTD